MSNVCEDPAGPVLGGFTYVEYSDVLLHSTKFEFLSVALKLTATSE